MVEIASHKVDNSIERHILVQMVVNDEFLQKISGKFQSSYIQASHARILCEWCLEHYKTYGVAPKKEIMSILEDRKDEVEEAEEELMRGLLRYASKEWEEDMPHTSTEFQLDRALEHFNAQAILKLSKELTSKIRNGDIAGACAQIGNFNKMEKPSSKHLTVGTDKEQIIRALNDSREELFRMPGDFGKMLGPICRKDFIAIAGSEKAGKCATANSMVALANGTRKRIVDILPGVDDILAVDLGSHRIIKTRANHLHENGLKRVYKLKTRTGRVTEKTGNHPFYTPTGWRDLDSLRVGDRIAVPRYLPIFDPISIYSNEELHVLAYLIADGGMTTSELVFSKQEPEIMQHFLSCVGALGCGYRYLDGGASAVAITNNANSRNKHNANRIKALLCQNGLFGKRSVDKHIPDSILASPDGEVALFLNTLFTCDGSVHAKGVDYSSGSRLLIGQVHDLLLRFGIVSRIREKIVNSQSYWELVISAKEDLERFSDSIGMSFSKKDRLAHLMLTREQQDRTNGFFDTIPKEVAFEILEQDAQHLSKRHKAYIKGLRYKGKNISRRLVKEMSNRGSSIARKHACGDLMWDSIQSIEDVGMQETYDLSVPVHHNFISDSILVHNSWMLLEFSMRAVKAGCNVAWFDAGDMSEDEIHKRFIDYECRGTFEEGQILKIPVLDCRKNQDDSCTLPDRACDFGVLLEKGKGGKKSSACVPFEDAPDYVPCTHCRKNDPREYEGAHWYKEEKIHGRSSEELAKQMLKRWAKKNAKQVRVRCFPSDTLTCERIDQELDIMEAEDGFIPDVLIDDYFDIMVSKLSDKQEARHQINDVWKNIRRISQQRMIAVIGGTQTNQGVFKEGKVSQNSMSEDKRKMGHVTAMVGIAALPDEKESGIIKANMVVKRHGYFNVNRMCHVLQCLEIGRACLGSYFAKG